MAWSNAVNAVQTGIQSINAGVWTGSTTTQFNVQIGGATNNLVSVAPSATSGVPLISQGSSSNPVFGTAVVAGGGTGTTTFTAYSVITAGTTATGQFQNVSGLGSAGQVLTSSGAGALPVWSSTTAALYPWTDEGVNFLAVINNGYFSTAALTATLPASPVQGDTVAFICDTSGAVVVTANTGQKIRLGGSITSTAGTLTSTSIGDSLELVYRTTGTTWETVGSGGNWLVA
ncbi:MAG: hypothetical protein V4509_01930 [Patescibacteria group bacterium]